MYPSPHRLIWYCTMRNESYSIEDRWRQKWVDGPNFENKSLILDPTVTVPGFLLPRKLWKTMNRLRTGHGCCGEKMFLWKYTDSPLCDCDHSSIQTMRHIINDCSLRRFPGGISEIHSATTDSIVWLENLDLNLWIECNNFMIICCNSYFYSYLFSVFVCVISFCDSF